MLLIKVQRAEPGLPAGKGARLLPPLHEAAVCWASSLQGFDRQERVWPRCPQQSWVMPLVSAWRGKDLPVRSGSGWKEPQRRISRIPAAACFPPSLIFTSATTPPTPPPLNRAERVPGPQGFRTRWGGWQTLMSRGLSPPLPTHPTPPCSSFLEGSGGPHTLTAE